jgi:hypothetical protein
MASSTR